MASNSNVVEIFKKCIKVSTYLTLSPFELKSKNLNISNCRKFWTLFHLLILIIGIFYSFYGRVIYKIHNELPYELFLDFTSEFLLFLNSFTICFTANFIYRNDYRTLFDLILKIDKLSKNKINYNKTTQLLWYFETIAVFIILSASFLYQHYVIIGKHFNIYCSPLIYLNFHYGTYVTIFVLLKIIYILIFIGKQCQWITEEFTKSINDLICAKGNEVEVINRIRITGNNIRNINKLVQEINKIFGWFLFMYLIYFTETMFYGIFLVSYSQAVQYNTIVFLPYLIILQVNIQVNIIEMN